MPDESLHHTAITPEEQIDEWRRGGMNIPDRECALHFLRNGGAGCLWAYLPPFRDAASGRFHSGVDFGAVAGLFVFDRNLRLTVLDAALRVESAVRAQMTVRGILPMVHPNSREARMSMRELKNRFGAVRPFALRQSIAGEYGMESGILLRFLHHLADVRNACAHNHCVWNWRFPILPVLPAKKPALKPFFNYAAQGKIYNTLVILAYLTDIISPERDWRRGLFALMASREQSAAAMGFLPGWRALRFWADG